MWHKKKAKQEKVSYIYSKKNGKKEGKRILYILTNTLIQKESFFSFDLHNNWTKENFMKLLLKRNSIKIFNC